MSKWVKCEKYLQALRAPGNSRAATIIRGDKPGLGGALS